MALTTSQLLNLLDPAVRVAINRGLESSKLTYTQYWNLIDSPDYYYEDVEVGGLPLLQEIGELEDIPQIDYTVGPKKIYTPTTIAGKIVASRLAQKYARLNVVTQHARMIGSDAADTLQYYATNLLNNGTSVTTPDGVVLFSTSHVNYATGGTYANTVSSPATLDYSSLLDLYNVFVTMTGHKVLPSGREPVYLVVHTKNLAIAESLVNSNQIPGSNNNDVNFFYKRLKVIADPLLSNQEAFFLIGEKRYHKLNMVFWTRPKVFPVYINPSNKAWEWSLVCDFKVDVSSAIGVAGEYPS